MLSFKNITIAVLVGSAGLAFGAESIVSIRPDPLPGFRVSFLPSGVADNGMVVGTSHLFPFEAGPAVGYMSTFLADGMWLTEAPAWASESGVARVAGVSADALTIVGSAYVVYNPGILPSMEVPAPFAYRSGSGYERLALPAGSGSGGNLAPPVTYFAAEALAVSDNGEIILGTASPILGTTPIIRWTGPKTIETIFNPPVLPSGFAVPIVGGLSPEGNAAVFGFAWKGYRWVEGLGVELLPEPAGYEGNFIAPAGVASNGKAVVGTASMVAGIDMIARSEAWIWNPIEGVRLLPSLEIDAAPMYSAVDVSADGRFVVGNLARGSEPFETWIYSPVHGTRSILAELRSRGVDTSEWASLHSVTSISRNGRFITGMGLPVGETEPVAFVVDLGVILPADLTEDGAVDFDDLLAFINLYNGGSGYADFNGDGTLDFTDFLAFLNAYNEIPLP